MNGYHKKPLKFHNVERRELAGPCEHSIFNRPHQK